MINKNCEVCGKIFQTWRFRIKQGNGKYCSKKCYGITKVGKPNSHPKAKGMKAWNRGLELPNQRGEKNHNWKG